MSTADSSHEIEELFVEFPNGDVFRVAALPIAKHLANQNADSYDDEDYRHLLRDELLLRDWLQNEMSWDEIEPHAEQVDREWGSHASMWADQHHGCKSCR